MKNVFLGTIIMFTHVAFCQRSITGIAREIAADLTESIEKKEPITASQILAKFPIYAALPTTCKSFFETIVLKEVVRTEEKTSLIVHGDAEIFGQTIHVRYMGTLEGSKTHASFLIGLPTSYTLSQLMSSLLGLKPLSKLLPGFKKSDIPDLAFEKVALIIAAGSYEDEEWGDIDQGINLAGTVRLTGIVENISKLIGENLTQARLRGVFALPDITDSIFQISFPRTIRLLPFLKGIESGPCAIEIGFKEASALIPGIKIPEFSVTSNFLRITPEFFPLLSKPVNVSARIGVRSDKGEFSTSIDGEALIPSAQQIINIFPQQLTAGLPLISSIKKIPSNKVGGELGLTFDIDWAILGTTAIPISGIGGRWAFSLGDKKIGLALKAEVSSTGVIGDIVFDSEIAGRYSLQDIIFGFSDFIQDASRENGKEINIRDTLEKIVPNDLALEDFKLTIVPKDAYIGDKSYRRGFVLRGNLEIFGVKTEVDMTLSMFGVSLMGTMSPLDISTNGIQLFKLTHATDSTKGPLIDLQCNPTKVHFILSGNMQLPLLGINSVTDVNIFATSIQAKLANQLLFGLYESDIELLGESLLLSMIKGTENLYVKIAMKQSALSNLEKEAIKLARSMVPDFDDKTQAEFDRIQNRIDLLDREKKREYKKCIGSSWFWDQNTCKLLWNDIIKRDAEIIGLNVYRDVLLKPSTTIARGVLTAFSSITEFATKVLTQGINIESFTSQARLSEFLQKGFLPKVNMHIRFLDKDIDLKDMQFNFTDIPGSMQQIFGQLQKLVAA